MSHLRQPVIVAARRTPVGTAGRGLAGVDVGTLAATVLRAVVDDLGRGVPPVHDVVLGNCMGPGGNPARVAALQAGLGEQVPGLTVDRQCGSGLEAVNLAATMVRAGAGDLILAGGAESASTAPLRFWPGDPPVRYERAPFTPAGYPDPEMGEAAEAVAAEAGVDRQRQDRYAVRSHTAAAAADFTAELVGVDRPDGTRFERDERPRAGMTEQRLARLRPAFVPGGTVTAGNSCGVSDGAAAVAVVSERLRAAHGWSGLRVLATATCGSDPRLPGTGLVPAVATVLREQGVTPAELAAVEITEAFAGQVLACLDTLGIDERLVCADGGAIGLGHPWGASGAILVVRLFHRLVAGAGGGGSAGAAGGRANGRRLGLAACAVGGGMGVATLVDLVSPDGGPVSADGGPAAAPVGPDGGSAAEEAL